MQNSKSESNTIQNIKVQKITIYDQFKTSSGSQKLRKSTNLSKTTLNRENPQLGFRPNRNHRAQYLSNQLSFFNFLLKITIYILTFKFRL